jgi:hypothetical protein
VIAQRQVARQLEGRLADQPPVDLSRRGPVLHLREPVPRLARLEVDPHLGRVSVGDVDVEGRHPPGAGDDAGRQHPFPPGLLPRPQRRPRSLRRAGVDAESGQDGHDGLRWDHDVVAAPVPEVRRHAVGMRQLGQLGVEVRHGVAPFRPEQRDVPQ